MLPRSTLGSCASVRARTGVCVFMSYLLNRTLCTPASADPSPTSQISPSWCEELGSSGRQRSLFVGQTKEKQSRDQLFVFLETHKGQNTEGSIEKSDNGDTLGPVSLCVDIVAFIG